MRKYSLGILLLAGLACGQFGGPPMSWGSPGNGPPRPHNGYGKPPRPFSSSGPPAGSSGYPPRNDYAEDPIPPMADGDASYETQKLPSKLPILAPNGVVEIYNRVVDDLIGKLEVELQKREMDPMAVVIRPTPPGPVRVPGYLQKRPYRRPGAALYRAAVLPGQVPPKKSSKKGRSGVLPPETRFGDRSSLDDDAPSYRGSGKISNGPLEPYDDEKEMMETTSTSTTTTESPVIDDLPSIAFSSEEPYSSEEEIFLKPRSDEIFEETEASKEAPQVMPDSEEFDDENEKPITDKDVDVLMQHYQSKNNKPNEKYSGKRKPSKPVVVDPGLQVVDLGFGSGESKSVRSEEVEENKKTPSKPKPKKPYVKVESDESDESSMEDDEFEPRPGHRFQDDDEYDDLPEPGTGGGKRPQNGFYPLKGPPAVPAKPNAELSGLSKIKRASDVQVSVDARSANIRARLLVGPIDVIINESEEPMETNVKATIPELEAEINLMERHGVVFLQRFTLDRAYGQDVEISIPKPKKKKGSSKNPPSDPNHPLNIETRRQTKMAAHISMEVVKLLRSGNLRVNLMRTAQSSMSKLKLPIKRAKNKKKGKKNKRKSRN